MAAATRADSGHYVSARKRRGRPAARMQPPLTAMIDVVFLLLTFFILTMQFSPDEGEIPADLPRAQGQPAAVVTPLETLYVKLQPRAAEGDAVDIELSRHPTVITRWGELFEVLRRRRERFGPEVPVVIQPAAEVAWSHALNAYHQARRAGFVNIALAPPMRDR